MISTWGGERSGYASIGKRWNAIPPQTINASEAITIRKRCERANETRREIIPEEPIDSCLRTAGTRCLPKPLSRLLSDRFEFPPRRFAGRQPRPIAGRIRAAGLRRIQRAHFPYHAARTKRER